MSEVILKNVTKIYPLGKTQVRALEKVDLVIQKGEFTAFAGPSGCGKSTLLNLIGCMDTPTSGEIFLDGQEVSKMSDFQLTHTRLHKLGFIFQSFNLIAVLTVFENVEFPLILQKKMSALERKKRIHEVLDEVGLLKQADQKANELSGGQRQRVAIARALVTNPGLVLADEPTANLDSQTGEKVIELMKSMNKKYGTTFVFSTHDPKVMSQAQRVIPIADGLLQIESYNPHLRSHSKAMES